MLISGHQAFSDINDVLLVNVASILLNLIVVGHKLRDRQQFFEYLNSGSRHLQFRLSGVFLFHRCVVLQIRNIPTKFGEIGH